MLGEIAELLTANVYVNREGIIVFNTIKPNNQTLTAENYSTFKLLSDDKCKITKLVCEKSGQDSKENEIADIEIGNTTGSTLRLENDSITTTAELQTIYNRAFPLEYWSYECMLQGMPHFDVGDKFTLIDKKNVSYELLLLSHSFTYNGGMLSTFKAGAINSNGSKAGSSGSNSISNTISNIQHTVINVETVLAGNITADNIKANSITADRIDTKTITAESGFFDNLVVNKAQIADAAIDSAKIDQAAINSAHIQDLAVGTAQIADAAITNAKIGNLSVGNANIQNAAITNAKIENLAVDNAKIKDLNAEKITAGSINADRLNASVITAINASIEKAVIDTAKIGNLNVDNMSANVINAINAYIGNATINSAKIGNLSADKITSGEISTDILKSNIISAINASIGKISADHIDAGSLVVDNIDAGKITTGDLDAARITANVIAAIGLSTGKIDAKNINVDSIKIGNSNITDATISGAKITNASITNAKIANATIESAKIKSLDVSKLNAGTIDAGKISIGSASGSMLLRDNTLTIKDNEVAPKVRVQVGLDSRGKYGILVLNEKGNAIFDSDKGVLSEEGLSDGVVSTDKVKNDAIGSTKLNTDELFVGDNAFINKLKAVEIDASSITTGKISSERLDINGLISFEAFDKSLQPIFDVQGDKTYINGGMIAANTIKADKIDLLSGLTVKGPDNTNSFAIGDTGTIEVNGWLHSSNFIPGKSGYEIKTDGSSEFNQATIRGTLDVLDAGMTNEGTLDTDVRIWAGGSYANRESAKFRVNKAGDLFATNATLSGTLYGSLEDNNLHIKNSGLIINNELSALNDDGSVARIAPRALETAVNINGKESLFNTDVVFGSNNVKYSKGSNALNLIGTKLNIETKMANVSINTDSGEFGGLNIKGPSGGHHILRGDATTANVGSLIFDSEGNQGAKGDFSFTRKNYTEKCKVNIDGDLTVDEKINSQIQGIEMRSVKNSSWEGWGFYAT